MRKRLYRLRGFSLVELMVGMTIGIICLLVMAQVLGNQSAQKQTTASGANATTAGSIALYMIERDARMAGFGLNGAPLTGCKINGYYKGPPAISPLAFSFVPIEIVTGAQTDSLTITYGTSEGNLSPSRLSASHDGGNGDFAIDNRFGFYPGNLVVIAEDGVDSNDDGVNDCTLAEVTGLPTAQGQTDKLSHSSAGYTDSRTGRNTPSMYNKPGGIGIAYSNNALVYNIGRLPVSHRYTVDAANSRMSRQDLTTGAGATPIGDGIVALRARYGKDTDADGSIDLYDAATPTTAAGWNQVIAVRVAVVARSDKREGAQVSPSSITLWPDLTLPSGALASGPSMALSDEQRHYRYRIFQTLVPLRNRIWTIPSNG
ncbi:MAG: type pilus assembly protein PilW [Herminiimonas sp.]|nr:type pilus assembly protein PilW [Herminiimonas sp.]